MSGLYDSYPPDVARLCESLEKRGGKLGFQGFRHQCDADPSGEFRFVSEHWEGDNRPYHAWYIVDPEHDRELWQRWREELEGQTTRWCRWWEEELAFDEFEVSYDADKRPVLVVIKGIV